MDVFVNVHICQLCHKEKSISEFCKNRIKIGIDGKLHPNYGDWLCFDCAHSLQKPKQYEIDPSYEDLPETTKAYLAGLVDGEGCILLTRKKNGHSFDVRMTITNTNVDLLDWTYQHIGGLYYKRNWEYKDHPTWKISSTLVFTSQKARSILHALLPYLVIKKPQASLALSYFNLSGTQGNHISEKAINDRELIYLKMRELNKKGR